MQQSQQKRTQFREQIRRRQIHDLFNNIRKLNKERQRIRQQNVEISGEEKQQMKKRITNVIGKCFLSFYYKHFKSLGQGIDMLGKFVDSDVRLVSAALQIVAIQHGGFIVQLLKKQINAQTLQKICSQFGVTGQDNIIAQEIPTQGTIDLVNRLMNISKRIQYNKFSLQAAKQTCNILYQILQQNLHLGPQPQKPTLPQPQLLQNLCLSLNSLLDSPNHKPLKKHLQQLGLSQKLNQIIDKSVDLEVSVHSSILKLVFLFNGTDSNVQDLLNGITIISTDSTFKEKYVLYCIFFIRKKYRELLCLALITLNQIFQECPYFIDSIKTDYYDRVLQLVLDQDRSINVAALNVLSSIIFYSQSASDQLIQQTSILDYIYSRLIIQRNLPSNDPNSKKSIQRCSNILCDLLMTKNKKLKKILFSHHIWQLLYQSIQENNRLFSTIVVFKFFFTNIPRRDRMQILPSFLEAVGRLPLENDMIPEIKEVMDTLLYIFYHSMEHNDENHEQIVRLFQTNNIMKHIQNHEAEYQKNYKMTKQ